ncbi:hypothetical protein MA16_Dca013103 [Dendrobium catenatum]|uniref:Uncharacterized protein n=1 Tax=Dendrobium catenatum TaxID=906689 RepID=A0A2I0XJ07_9ASPA|nr:hypothetical protein MA16_Dca013103 [Dendrobium catenatum]
MSRDVSATITVIIAVPLSRCGTAAVHFNLCACMRPASPQPCVGLAVARPWPTHPLVGRLSACASLLASPSVGVIWQPPANFWRFAIFRPTVKNLFAATQFGLILTLVHYYNKETFHYFLANMSFNSDHSVIRLFIFKKKVEITKADLGIFLNLRTEGIRAHTLTNSSDFDWSEINNVIRGHGGVTHVPKVSTLSKKARIIQHVLRTSIIPKVGDRVNITPLISIVTYLIMTSQPIDEAQLIIDYLYGLSEIGHVSHKRKKNIALGHLVTYILEKKYDLVHPIQDFEEPLYYNDGSFRAIFHKETHIISDSEEEPEPAPTPAPPPAPTGKSDSLLTLGECEQPKGSLPTLGECEQPKGSLPTLGECEQTKGSLPTLGMRCPGHAATAGESCSYQIWLNPQCGAAHSGQCPQNIAAPMQQRRRQSGSPIDQTSQSTDQMESAGGEEQDPEWELEREPPPPQPPEVPHPQSGDEYYEGY